MKIDWWTLGLQAINVLVLLWILQRFLFKPVQAMIARRQQATQQLMADAATARSRAEAEHEALQAERLALAAEREKTLQAAREEARKAGQTLLAQAAQEARQRGEAATVALQRERAQAAGQLRASASVLAADMARQLLQRIAPADWSRRFVHATCEELAGLGDGSAAGQGEGITQPIEVISADTLADDDQAKLREALGRVAGHAAPVAFRVDPALLAGVEVRLAHRVIRNHWAADLDQLREQLQRHDHPA